MAKPIARSRRHAKLKPAPRRLAKSKAKPEAAPPAPPRRIIKAQARRALRVIITARRNRQVIPVPAGTDFLELWVSAQEFLALRIRQGATLRMAQCEWVGRFASGELQAYDCCLPKRSAHWFLRPVAREHWRLLDFSAEEAAAFKLPRRPSPESWIWSIDDKQLLHLNELRILAAVDDPIHEAQCWPGGALRQHAVRFYPGLARVTAPAAPAPPPPAVIPAAPIPEADERALLAAKQRELEKDGCWWPQLMALVDQHVRLKGKFPPFKRRGSRAQAWGIVTQLAEQHELIPPAGDSAFYHWINAHPQPSWFEADPE